MKPPRPGLGRIGREPHAGRFDAKSRALVAALLGACLVGGCARSAPSGVDCDDSLLIEPTSTPFSTPPTLERRSEALRTLHRELRRAGLDQGSELPHYRIESLIGQNGVVLVARVAPPTGDEGIDSAIVAAAREFRYRPARLGGAAVCFWLSYAGPSTFP
jgi:hypothetical protein